MQQLLLTHERATQDTNLTIFERDDEEFFFFSVALSLSLSLVIWYNNLFVYSSSSSAMAAGSVAEKRKTMKKNHFISHN
jgi:hypothetical protein